MRAAPDAGTPDNRLVVDRCRSEQNFEFLGPRLGRVCGKVPFVCRCAFLCV